jgi:hypothetical protein
VAGSRALVPPVNSAAAFEARDKKEAREAGPDEKLPQVRMIGSPMQVSETARDSALPAG